jgi:hypothetical protein
MTNMPLHDRSHILATLGSREDKAWEYNPSDYILVMDLRKLFILIGYDDKEQMSSIFTHIHVSVVDHVIIHVYVESCKQDGYNGHSMTLYHFIDIGCFLELDDLVHNPPLEVFVTCRLDGDVDDSSE